MKPSRSRYLQSLAFEEGEYEQSQASFDTILARFSLFIEGSVGSAMRAELEKEIASSWIEDADIVLRTFLTGIQGRDAAMALAVEDMRLTLRASPRLSEPTVLAEIQDCSHKIAELVLAQWYAELHALVLPATGIKLNANMLAGTRSIEDVLGELDLSGYLVSKAAIALAVRAFREDLLPSDPQDVIAFAPRLHMVFDATDRAQPFTCFATAHDAAAAVAEKRSLEAHVLQAPARVEIATWGGRKRDHHIRRIIATLQEVRAATLVHDATAIDAEILAEAVDAMLDNYSTASTATQTLELSGGEIVTPWSPEAPGMLLVESVGLGVDIYSCGLSDNEEQAGILLSGRSTPIRDLLFRYANARDIKNRAATDVYAIAVTAGLECQLGRRVVKSPAAVREIRAHLIGKLGNVYGVPASTLNEMLTDSWAGTDCIARPLSMFGL